MSSLSLNKDESALLIAEGWRIEEGEDGPKFSMSLGERKVTIWPTLKRKIFPMVFNSQARRYDEEYSQVAIDVGWGELFFSNDSDHPAMSHFEIHKFDVEFVQHLTPILRDYAVNADIPKLRVQYIHKRRKVRLELGIDDFIDYAYLGWAEELEQLTVGERGDSLEYIEDHHKTIEELQRAIAIAKLRPRISLDEETLEFHKIPSESKTDFISRQDEEILQNNVEEDISGSGAELNMESIPNLTSLDYQLNPSKIYPFNSDFLLPEEKDFLKNRKIYELEGSLYKDFDRLYQQPERGLAYGWIFAVNTPIFLRWEDDDFYDELAKTRDLVTTIIRDGKYAAPKRDVLHLDLELDELGEYCQGL